MDARSQSSAPEQCDLVMKGGITSGVVYPQAVLALKDRCRFRNIGGGSVGAVAAALTAAAELGRDKDAATGFNGMKIAQKKLAEERGFLQNLFRPPNTYKPLMDAALAFAPLLDDEERRWERQDSSARRSPLLCNVIQEPIARAGCGVRLWA